MAILWCGQEDLDFPQGAAISGYTGHDTESGYNRGSVMAWSWLGWTINSKPLAAPVTDCWLGFRDTVNGHPGDSGGLYVVGIVDSSKGSIYFDRGYCVRGGGYDRNLYRQAAADTYLFSFTGSSSLTRRIDLQFLNFGTNGTINLYINGSVDPIKSYTGDLTAGGYLSGFDRVVIGGSSFSDIYINSYREIIWATEDTRGFRLVTHAPSAAGDLNEWSGTYTDISEFGMNDATKIFVNSADKTAQFALTDMAAVPYDVQALNISARAFQRGVAINKLKLGVKYDGVEDMDAGQIVECRGATYNRLLTQINGAKITDSMANAMQLEFKSAT